MTLKSPLLIAVIACALALGLAACGGGGDDSSAEEAPPPPAPAEPTPAEPTPSEPGPAETPSPAPAEPAPSEPPEPAEPAEPAEPTASVSDTPVPTPDAVPSGAIAIVGATPIELAVYDELLTQREAAIEAGGGEFPAAGTPEFETLKNQAVQFLVQREQFRQEAEAVGISVTDDDLQAELQSLKDEFFESDEEQYQEELERQGLTEDQVLSDIEVRLLQDGLFSQITADIQVDDADVESYYADNEFEFTTAESRTVAHILVAEKSEADELYQQLQDGADFAELAAENSLDTGTAQNGGEYIAVRGQSVPEFEEAAYALETGDVSEPVESQFGWHIITALDDVTPETVQALEDVREQITSILRRDLETAIVEAWVAALEAKYVGKVLYAPGFDPPAADAALVDPTESPESP